jgi:putative inorganic carbon (HCO3(-)) transporter
VQAENREAHNLFLGIAAETGALGLICFLLIVGLTLYRLNTTRREVLDERPDLANTVTGWLLAIVAYLATGMFLHFAYVRYFWLILALGEVSNLITRKEWDSHNNPAARRSSP